MTRYLKILPVLTLAVSAFLSCSCPDDPTPEPPTVDLPGNSVGARAATPEEQQTFPIRDEEAVPTFAEVAKAMIGDPSITVAEAEQQLKLHVARRYIEGGERYYSVETGEPITDFPKELLELSENDRPLVYAALWLRENAPGRVACARRNFPLVQEHPAFLGLCRSCLFHAKNKEDQNRVARSIVRNFCLGGEYQVNQSTPPGEWKREKRIGGDTYRTVREYVDVIARNRATPAYCATLQALKAPENMILVDKFIDSYRKKQ